VVEDEKVAVKFVGEETPEVEYCAFQFATWGLGERVKPLPAVTVGVPPFAITKIDPRRKAPGWK
jgi:hypothetical protein